MKSIFVCSSVCGSVQQQEGIRKHEKMNVTGWHEKKTPVNRANR